MNYLPNINSDVNSSRRKLEEEKKQKSCQLQNDAISVLKSKAYFDLLPKRSKNSNISDLREEKKKFVFFSGATFCRAENDKLFN